MIGALLIGLSLAGWRGAPALTPHTGSDLAVDNFMVVERVDGTRVWIIGAGADVR